MVNSRSKVLFATSILMVALLISSCATVTKNQEFPSEKKLLKGDLHCHSSYSHDGFYSIEEVCGYAKKAGFDFISITDHNTKNHFRDPYVDDTLIMIPGYELTLHRGVGHLNIFGITDFKENVGMVKIEDINDYTRMIQEKGGRVQINHPYDPHFYWGKGFDFAYDYYELWNGSFNEEEDDTLAWWQEQLSRGNKVVATGGSDSHKSKEERYPVNCVYVDDESQGGILEALDKGNLYVSKSAKGPHIKFHSGIAIMGDEIEFSEGLVAKIEITDLDVPSIVRIYTNEGMLVEKTVAEATFNEEIEVEDKGFYRVEVWQDSETMSAFSNPIFIK